MSYKAEDTILYVDKVSVGYEGKTILKDVSLVEKNIVREGHDSTGQTIAFLGRSGRGKSTLFKALTGLLQPSTGQILISDMKTEAKDDAKILSEGDVGFVDQKYTLFRHKTIYQICEYALKKSKLTKEEKKALITEYLTEWGLLEHKDKYSCELSGGQRQRTAIIEQMLSSKHFMILDEPFSGLDVGNIEKVKTSFQKILDADEYNTIIFSTHDIRLAVELADSIYVIGFPEGVTDYSTILKHYDLKNMGLAWTAYGDGHRKLVTDIKELLLKS
jgi:ABC-type nitrate/sulfonate/bicarbonate transport system ATPase subunit